MICKRDGHQIYKRWTCIRSLRENNHSREKENQLSLVPNKREVCILIFFLVFSFRKRIYFMWKQYIGVLRLWVLSGFFYYFYILSLVVNIFVIASVCGRGNHEVLVNLVCDCFAHLVSKLGSLFKLIITVTIVSTKYEVEKFNINGNNNLSLAKKNEWSFDSTRRL